jgi:ABC-type transport system substrate-binding protein
LSRDELVGALGDKITVQESDWNCGGIIEPNHKRKPFDDPRVRRALTLAIDRWHGAPRLARIANVHTVGGIVFPGSPAGDTLVDSGSREIRRRSGTDSNRWSPAEGTGLSPTSKAV